MTPIEAMARALDPEAWDDTPVPVVMLPAWKVRQARSLEDARAALTALRDCTPSTKMWYAWQSFGNSEPDGDCEAEWRAMLDAALEGK